MRKRRSFLDDYTGEDLEPLKKGVHTGSITSIEYCTPRNTRLLRITITSDQMARNRDQKIEIRVLNEFEVDKTGNTLDFLKNLWATLTNSIEYDVKEDEKMEFEDFSHVMGSMCLGEYDVKRLLGSKIYFYHRPMKKWKKAMPSYLVGNLDQYQGFKDRSLLRELSRSLKCDLVSVYREDNTFFVNCTGLEKNYPITQAKYLEKTTDQNEDTYQSSGTLPTLTLVSDKKVVNSWDEFTK